MNTPKKSNPIYLIAPLVYLAVGVIVVLIIARNGQWPLGEDTYYYIYRGSNLYDSIKNGVWYSLIDFNWYNGVQITKCASQLTPYVLAFCQFLTGGNALNAYLIFILLVFFLGGLPWLVIGMIENRPYLCSFLGLYWFFMPNNLLAMFKEGNLARCLAMIFMPVFIYSMYSYLKKQDYRKLIPVTLSFILIIFCHLGYAGMIAITSIVFLIVYSLANHKYRASLEITLVMLLAFAITGIWIVAYLFGEGTSVDSSETMKSFFQNLFVTINPVDRLKNFDNFYYGLSLVILAVFGIFFAKKEEKSSFITSMIFLLLSTNSMYVVLKLMPGNQYLWMTRFFSIAICLSLIAFVYWKSLRNLFVVIICVLMVADVVPSYSLIYGDSNGITPETTLDEIADYTLINEAKEITTQRIALLDLSTLAARGAYIVSGYQTKTASSFGAGWEAATTAQNIVQLNKALEQGFYYYLFDRALELGDDTVIISAQQAELYEYTLDDITTAAESIGYSLYDSNKIWMLYHYDDAPAEGFGVISEYKAIGIGSNTSGLSLKFPGLKECDTTNLNDFTYEELSKYELIYLDGFTWSDRESAEELILKLSENGVRIVITADNIPEDRKSHDQSFLGVVCHNITFTNGFPELDTIDGILNTDLFPQGYTTWGTVYLEGLSNVWGTVYDNDIELPFYGTGQNENLIYIGLNLPYFYTLTRDSAVSNLLSHAMDFDATDLPTRTVVPVTTEINGNTITITTDYDNVDTTLAYHDIFESDETIYGSNNLTYVNSGTTVITMKYPLLVPGIIVSVAGLILFILFLVMIKKEYNDKESANS